MNGSTPVIWNRQIRFLHWGLAICVALNFLNDGDGIKLLHKVVGFTALGLVLLRIFYGLSSKLSPGFHHLFYNWPLSFSAFRQFIKSEWARVPIQYGGHNPPASWTYVGIWLAVVALGVTGFLMGLDEYWGEEWLEDLHAAISNVLMVLILIHIIGFLKDSVRFKRKTWMRMIKGQ